MFQTGKETEARTQSNTNFSEVLITQLENMNIAFDELRRKTIFHTRCGVKDNTFSMIIDFGSGVNVVSSYVVEKLKLACIQHTSHKRQWINSLGEYKVTKQCMISFSIGKYSDNVLCDVIPMQDCHIMLGSPWQLSRNAIHDRRKIKFLLSKIKENIHLHH